ncbi:MAG: diguanylate cyclase [Terriglobia bacterium]|jgi:diguanylate cyclase (GGDEF)-like protein
MDAHNNLTQSADANARILIVFEGAKDRFLLETWLTHAGFHCHTASNGEEALEILGQREFDVLICDLGPPVVPGLALLETAREKYPRMSFMFAAGMRKPRAGGTARKSGEELDPLLECLWKPLNSNVVVARVKATLKHKQFQLQGPDERKKKLQQDLDEWSERVKAAGLVLRDKEPGKGLKGTSNRVSGAIVGGILILVPCSVLVWIYLRHPLLAAFGLISCLVSCAGLHFIIRGVCKRILLRQSGRTYFQSIANANRLEFPSLRKSLEEFGAPVDYSRLRMMLKCDFLALTHLLKNSSLNRRYSNEERLLRVYFRFQFFSLALRHSLRLGEKKTILRMTLILQHFANLVGPRSSATHGFDIDSVELRLNSGEEFATDGLTGLKSRRMFNECLAQEINRSIWDGTSFALIRLDVRNLKSVNDTFGHPTGDEILRTVARASVETFRGCEICCRIGGDEFAILLPQSERSSAEALAEGITRKFEVYVKPLAPNTPVGIDYGIAVFPEDGEDQASLFQFANTDLCERTADSSRSRE